MLLKSAISAEMANRNQPFAPLLRVYPRVIARLLTGSELLAQSRAPELGSPAEALAGAEEKHV